LLTTAAGHRQRSQEQERDQEKKKQKQRQECQKQTSNYGNNNSDNGRLLFLGIKIDEVTGGLRPEYARLLYNTSADNAQTIIDYVLSIKTEAHGITPKGQQVDQLKPTQCPNCNEPNKPDSKFCAKCRMVLTYDAYSETLEKQQEKDSEVQVLKQKYEQEMKSMREEMNQQLLQIMSMIQQNIQLAYIKPEALTTKKMEVVE